MGYRAATDISIGPFFTKFYGEKDGDTPQTPNIDFSRFMSISDGLILGGYPPPCKGITTRDDKDSQCGTGSKEP